jgi:sulfhydrogenase subunit beta (sulfur reductase)
MMRIIELASLDRLFSILKNEGYRIIGPTLRDDAIVYDELHSPKDLPAGWTDEQDGGTYRLKKRTDGRLFGYAVGPHSWKRTLYPPEHRLWSATYGGAGFQVKPEKDDESQFAFIGARSCDIHAIQVQDRVFIRGPFPSAVYEARRSNTIIIAVNCTDPGGTCFCVSMNTGPRASSGFDLALTEIIDNGRHYFAVEVGTKVGEEILSELSARDASKSEEAAAEKAMAHAAAHMGRTLDTTNIKELFYENFNHPHWDAVAKRCLTCGNCTLVCPTCFCATVEDRTDLGGKHTERWRKWDSCFVNEFSYIVGGSIRQSTKSRYRQWITHKLAYWLDQFGVSGCVGCGRCITWCPVGIDITEETRALREESAAGAIAAGKGSTQPHREG